MLIDNPFETTDEPVTKKTSEKTTYFNSEYPRKTATKGLQLK
jgi:hypothetical protein